MSIWEGKFAGLLLKFVLVRGMGEKTQSRVIDEKLWIWILSLSLFQ